MVHIQESASGGIPRKPRDAELDVFGVTHIGKVRTQNQDHFLIASLHKHLAIHHTSIPPESISATDTDRLAFLAMVADGVGGSAGGEEASRYALDGITRIRHPLGPLLLHGRPQRRRASSRTCCRKARCACTPS